MRLTSFLFILAFVTTVTLIVACNSGNDSVTTGDQNISNDSLVKRGSYLVNAIGCDDCHSPKTFGPNGPQLIEGKRFGGHIAGTPLAKPDTTSMKNWMLMAHDLTAAVGPWGISYAANISSDSTGIGLWKEEQFIKAIREGLYKGLDGSRPMLPPMPWTTYRNLSDIDLKAIFAYLKTTPPVRNVVPQWKKINEL